MIEAFPHTIENGAGETLTFVRVVPTDRGDRLEVEFRALAAAGPPMHVHHLQEEAMTVLAGRVGYQIPGRPPQYAEAGESVVFPPGMAHRWWNAGTTELHGTGWMMPPLNGRYFLTALFASMQRSGGKRPGLFDVAFLLTRYRSEFAMLQIPAVVQHLLFPILLVVGRLLGKYGRYADAPPAARQDR